MKNFHFIIKCCLAGLLTVFSVQSCTDLDEEVYSQILVEDFFQTDEEVLAAVGAAYTTTYGYVNFFAPQEVTSDEIVLPTRGTDWLDGGGWQRAHKHTYNSEEGFVAGAWTFCYNGISSCNGVLDILLDESTTVANADAFVGELRALRAFYYSLLLDLYGNVPIVETFDVPSGFLPTQSSRQEVYDFVITELEAVIPNLPTTVDLSTYGRMNTYAAQALLASVTLNAEEYTGSAQWQKTVDACDVIINSGNYSLTANYFDNFSANNEGSSEFIYAIPYDEVFAQGFNLPAMTLHYVSQNTFDLTFQPWNGYATMQEFYDSYEATDERLGNFLVGPQFESDGVTPIEDAAAEETDPDGPPLNFTPELTALDAALRQEGARIGKYEFELGANANLNNDVPVYRYGGVLLMKAEALWRMDASSTEALDLVNQIRARAGVAPFTELTAENLLAERGREMFFEGNRRTDLIRFGKYNDAWWEHPADPSTHVNLYPIPKAQIDNNPNLTQNPGYN